MVPVEPETPAGAKGYYVSSVNAKGTIYFDGTVSGGRFNGVYDKAQATLVYVEAGAEAGDYLLYIMVGDVKTYIVMEDQSKGAVLATDVANATVYVWNATLKTMVVKNPDNGRAFGTQLTSTYDNMSTYATSNTEGYSWGAFVAADGTEFAPEA